MHEPPPFQLIAGHVVLDFVNTLDNRYEPVRVQELIPSYAELLRFCEESGIISDAQKESLSRLNAKGAEVVEAAHHLREALERIFAALIHVATPTQGDLDIVNGATRDALQHRAIGVSADGMEWQWPQLVDDARGPLWLITNAAAELLVSTHLARVRECSNETCRWLFLDTSKNHSRRWCDMKVCGNRAKARNYYWRSRHETGAD